MGLNFVSWFSIMLTSKKTARFLFLFYHCPILLLADFTLRTDKKLSSCNFTKHDVLRIRHNLNSIDGFNSLHPLKKYIGIITGGSCIYHLIIINHYISSAFDRWLEVPRVHLDILKDSDKRWHDDSLFKLRQNAKIL